MSGVKSKQEDPTQSSEESGSEESSESGSEEVQLRKFQTLEDKMMSSEMDQVVEVGKKST